MQNCLYCVYNRHFVQCIKGNADLVFDLAAFQQKNKNNCLQNIKFESIDTKTLSDVWFV